MVVDRPVSAARAGRAPRAALLAGGRECPAGGSIARWISCAADAGIDDQRDTGRERRRHHRDRDLRRRSGAGGTRGARRTARLRRGPQQLQGARADTRRGQALAARRPRRARALQRRERARGRGDGPRPRPRALERHALLAGARRRKRAARSCARRGHDHQRLPLRAPQVRRRRAGRRRYAARARATADRRCARRRRRRRGGRTARRRRQPRARPAESPRQ